jgi:hypothetical protein
MRGFDPYSIAAVLGMFVVGFGALMLVPRSRRIDGGFRPRSPVWVVSCCLLAAAALLVFASLFLSTCGHGIFCSRRRGLSDRETLWLMVLGLVFIADSLAIFAWDVWRTRNDPARGARWNQ